MNNVTYANLSFSHNKVTNRRKYTDIHYHDDYELYYMINGTTKYFIGDEIFKVGNGNFVLVPKKMFHKTDSEDCLHNDRILISFNDDLLTDDTRVYLDELCRCKLICIPSHKMANVESIVYKIEEEYKNTDDYSSGVIRLLILYLLTELCRHKLDRVPVFDSSSEFIHQVSKYISTNYSEPLSLSYLSHKFSISESHLSRLFKSVSGIGINQFITHVRIMNAEYLLKTTRLSITEISALCGFNDSNYFSTIFKRLRGTTPLKYAAAYRSKSN